MHAPFQWIAEHAPVGIFLVNGEGRPIYFNPRACEVLGRSESTLLRHGWGSALHAGDRRRLIRLWRKALGATGRLNAEYRLCRPDGSTVWVHGKVAGVRRRGGGWRIFVGSLSDVSQRKQAELALEESRNRIATMLNACPLAILSLDRQGRVQSWNRGAEHVFGWSEAEALGRVCPTVPRAERTALRRMIARVLAGETVRGRTLLRRRKDGGTVMLAASVARVLDGAGKPTGVVAILDDITGREILQVQLQALLEDRERLLRDLHDGCIQSLFAIGLGLELCQRVVASDPGRARALIDEATTNLNLVIRELRASLTLREGRPPAAPELRHGIEHAVQAIGSAGPRFALDLRADAAGMLEPQAAHELLHIAREGISNIVRHSRAGRAAVSLQRHGGGVRMVLADDGAGIRPAARKGRGQGLRGIAERVRQLGGRLRIVSTPRRGTRLTIEVPAGR